MIGTERGKKIELKDVIKGLKMATMKHKDLIEKFKDKIVMVMAMLTPDQILDIKENGKNYFYLVNETPYLITDAKNTKVCISESYNFTFDKLTGDFKRWGKDYNDDPQYAPIGPEIWDCECTTICNGIKNVDGHESPCRFCYKSNTMNGSNLSFNDFKTMIDLFPKSLGQIAFGADSKAKSNQDLWKMMEYCRLQGVIPNITVADVDDCVADKLKQYCGAVAVSRYANKDICYDSIKKLATDRKMKQINIHAMLSTQTFEMCMETVRDMMADKRLKDMNAVVFLGLKKRGRAADGDFDILPFQKFRDLIMFCMENDIRFGFDSCSAPRFEKTVREMELAEDVKKNLIGCSESCESGIFSFYTSVEGKYFPCSFTEGIKKWEDGISMLDADNFLNDIWYNDKNVRWRSKLIQSQKNGCRQCMSFPEINV